VSAEGTFPCLIFLGIVHQHAIRARLNTLLTAIAFLFIYEHYLVLALVYRFSGARREARRPATVHTRYGKIIHAQVGILTAGCVSVRPTYSVHPDSRKPIQVVLHLAGYVAGLTPSASVQVDN
jgi:hypothetical protein